VTCKKCLALLRARVRYAARVFWRVLCWLALVAATAHAERLPVRLYTSADGLASDRVERGTRDAAGFLWFATGDGVSRFDGHRFVSFGKSDGLPAAQVHDVAVARDGTIWAATDAGVAWLDPRARGARFHAVAVPADTAVMFHQDPAGTLRVGTVRGLFELERRGDQVTTRAIPLGAGRQPQVLAITHDPVDDSLWFGTSRGVMHRERSGAIHQYRVGSIGELDDRVFGVLIDRKGRLWIGHVGSRVLAVVLPHGRRLVDTAEPLWEVAARGGDWLRFELQQTGARRGILEDSRGNIWIGTQTDLVMFDGQEFHTLRERQLQHAGSFTPCVEDAAGNLWLGGESQGVLRLAPDGLVAFDRSDGLQTLYISGFVQDPRGPLHTLVGAQIHVVHRRDGDRFVAISPRLPFGLGLQAWGWNQTAAIDRDGSWWYPTGRGVARYPAVSRLEDLATTLPEMFTEADGLHGRDVFRMYEDRAGDVWITTLSKTGLARWNRATGKITTLGAGWPTDAALAFAEDATGAVWIGYSDGKLVRARGGRPEIFGPAEGLVGAPIHALLLDHAGRLWIATHGAGVQRIDQPALPRPSFTTYNMTKGLATDQALSLVEDRQGQIYIGTTRGIDRLDPISGAVTHYTTADGLPDGYVHVSARDRDGVLWFGTPNGLARLVVAGPRSPPVHATFITELVVGERSVPLAVDGEQALPALELGPEDDQLDIRFTSPSFVVGEQVRFQYRLDGSERGWSLPSPAREVHFARLAPGSYQFEVRGVYPGGRVTPAATLPFEVMAPIWRRWWFVVGCGLVVALAAHAISRWRLSHLLAVERVRTRIATDLHDDLGASLSRISILSEVAARRLATNEAIGGHVGDIGRQARELVDTAADIVWSTDPRHDDLGSSLVRLRSFAGDVFEARGIEWSLVGPTEASRIHLGPERRRHLYLIVKEAINNAAKHSQARRVSIAITNPRGTLETTIVDDGVGFDATARKGNGLANMRARATQAAGTLEVVSTPGTGTAIVLRLPLG